MAARKLQKQCESSSAELSTAAVPEAPKSETESKLSPSPSPSPAEPSARVSVDPSAAERGQRDLFFFTKEICKYDLLLPRVHQQVCDIYPTLDLSEPIDGQDGIHNCLILDPRGEFKTSISLAKSIQNWINFPEHATLRMSGKEGLVKGMVQEIKDQFLTNTTLRSLYPEHMPWSTKKGEENEPPSDFGTAYGITNPSRKRPRKEPTLSISTLESVKASTHYEWITGDDLVHEKNYQTRELLLKTISDWELAHNLLNPGGYRELLGTRYDWSDLYGDIIENHAKAWSVHDRPVWTPATPENLEYATRAGFVTSEVYRHPETGELLWLLHPERWSFEKLLEVQRENGYLFSCQRLNNPQPTSADSFPKNALIRHTITRDRYPDTGMMNIYMAWFYNFADAEAEQPVGVVGGWDSKGRLFLIDLVTGDYRPSQVVELMIGMWQKWPIRSLILEDNKRYRMIEPGIMSRLKAMKLWFPIDWVKFGGSNQSDDDMISQVLALEPLLWEHQFWFHAELPHLDKIYLQFSRFPKFKNRGIPYAVSRLMHYRTLSSSITAQTVYGSELYSPALSWDRDDPELGAGLVG